MKNRKGMEEMAPKRAESRMHASTRSVSEIGKCHSFIFMLFMSFMVV